MLCLTVSQYSQDRLVNWRLNLLLSRLAHCFQTSSFLLTTGSFSFADFSLSVPPPNRGVLQGSGFGPLLCPTAGASQTVVCPPFPWGSCRKSDPMKAGLERRLCSPDEFPGGTLRPTRPRTGFSHPPDFLTPAFGAWCQALSPARTPHHNPRLTYPVGCLRAPLG